ncbi:hypothetical protein H0H92_002118 [Tricholoma furcatifolium]|nr:hypothetical protein H0H92_002118 [Tricholoma furcatifolium]
MQVMKAPDSNTPHDPYMPPHLSRRQYMEAIFNNLRNYAKGDGIPRVPDPEHAYRMRIETLNHIQRIRTLEDEIASGSPTSPRVHEQLMIARATYHIFFPRIFRFNDLPPEIITTIFRFVLWPNPNPSVGTLARLHLTWTCRRWREIAINDFSIWNAVWFRDRAPFTRSFAFLERARSAPLDLRIGSEDTTKTISLEDLESLLDRLFLRLPQFRILIFIGSSWEHVRILLKKLSTTQYGVPALLERLEIHRLGGLDFSKRQYLEPITLFDSQPAPKLHYLSLNSVHINWNTGILHNLTTLDFRKLPLELCPTLERFREMLAHCPLLRKLCMDGAGPQFKIFERPAFPVVMANLKILVICDFSATYARHVLTHFTAPNLLDLTFINFTGEDYSPLYESLIDRFPKIKLLTMYSVALNTRKPAVVKWLASMPQLTYLRVASLPLSFFELLLSDPRTVIAPQEEHQPPPIIFAPKLTVVESHPSVVVSLVKFATERLAMGVPLQRVYVTRMDENRENEELRKACTELTKITSVLYMANGTRTPEEEAIMAE